MSKLEFVVNGVPVPQGSMRRSKHGAIIHSSAKLKAWRNAVRDAAILEAKRQGWRTCDAPCALSLTFLVPAPKRPMHPGHASTKPDLDKLVRGIGDALEGVVYSNDSRVVSINAGKYPCNPRSACVRVCVERAG